MDLWKTSPNNKKEQSKVDKKIDTHTQESTKNLSSSTFSLNLWAATRRNFTNKCREYKWCNDTLTKLKPQYIQIILSHKYKVLSLNTKAWDSIQSLGLHLIQREIFSHNPPTSLFILPHHWLTFCCSATSLLNNRLHIYSEKHYTSVGKQARKPCNKEVNNFGNHDTNLTYLM